MEGLARISLLRRSFTVLPAAAGFIISYWFIHRSGVGVSPDSIAYVSAAHNLVQSGRLIDYTSHPLVDFPAGYPMLLALLMRLTHADPLDILQYLDPALFALLIGLCGYMADRMGFPNRWYKPLLLVCIVLSPALIEVYIMLWSEAVFIVLVVLFMITFRRYLYRHSLGTLVLAAFVAGLSCTMRYAGVTLVATGGLLLLFERGRWSFRRFGHVLLYGVVSSVLLAWNLWQNVAATGTLTGARQKGITPLLRNISYYGDTFSGWFLFGNSRYLLGLIVGLVILLVLVLLVTRGLPRLKGDYPTFIRIGLAFSLLYSVFMVLSATISRYEEINSRLLSPLYIPLVFSLAFPLGWLSRRVAWRIAAVVVLLLVLSSQCLADYRWYADVAEGGIGGYTEDDWDDSPLVKYLEGPSPFLPGYTLYSNSPEGVYFFGGFSCQLLPQKAFPGPIAQYYAGRRQYLVWFDDGTNDAILSLQDVLTHKQMKLVRQFTDGAVYITGDQ